MDYYNCSLDEKSLELENDVLNLYLLIEQQMQIINLMINIQKKIQNDIIILFIILLFIILCLFRFIKPTK
jgi:hypothetical protein